MAGKAQGDPVTTKQLVNIETRAERIKARATAHHRANKDAWVAREAIRLWKAHVRETSKLPVETVTEGVSVDNLMWKARHNVKARGTQRLARINGIKSRMQNAVIRNLETQSPAQALTQSGPKQTQKNRLRHKGPVQ